MFIPYRLRRAMNGGAGDDEVEDDILSAAPDKFSDRFETEFSMLPATHLFVGHFFVHMSIISFRLRPAHKIP